ncbi:AI-2E family transporter [Sphingomonas sp. LR61]|uniref:AI-2E family transporter n=1 Tax=Sphingomonas sp. LR61 TaxID=3050234 RepID=UPI002FDFAE96
MVVTAVLGAAVSALDALALVLLGVPGAALWGLLAFITGFIPNIGYWIGIIPPVILALLANGWQNAIVVIVVYAVINGVIQSGLQPHIVGSAVSLNQTIAFLSVVFWSAVLGPMGAVLAIPLTLLVRAVLVDANPDARWMRPVLGDVTGLGPPLGGRNAAHRPLPAAPRRRRAPREHRSAHRRAPAAGRDHRDQPDPDHRRDPDAARAARQVGRDGVPGRLGRRHRGGRRGRHPAVVPDPGR